jgi:hypothetical protein
LINTRNREDVHVNAVYKYTNFTRTQSKKSIWSSFTAAAVDDAKSQSTRKYFEKLVKCAYCLIKKRWALSINFEEFVRFTADLGVKELSDFLAPNPPVTCLSSTSVSDIIDAISKPIEIELLELLQNADYFALLADESTDQANREQFSILCKWLHNEEVKEHYVGLIHVKKTDAHSLMSAIEQFFTAKNIDLTKVRFLGFDGTNTMSGEISGN